MDRAGPSEFLRGNNDRNWKINLDFFLRPDSVTKILEGNYDNGENRARKLTHNQQREQANSDAFTVLSEAIASDGEPSTEAALFNEESSELHTTPTRNLGSNVVDV